MRKASQESEMALQQVFTLAASLLLSVLWREVPQTLPEERYAADIRASACRIAFTAVSTSGLGGPFKEYRNLQAALKSRPRSLFNDVCMSGTVGQAIMMYLARSRDVFFAPSPQCRRI